MNRLRLDKNLTGRLNGASNVGGLDLVMAIMTNWIISVSATATSAGNTQENKLEDVLSLLNNFPLVAVNQRPITIVIPKNFVGWRCANDNSL